MPAYCFNSFLHPCLTLFFAKEHFLVYLCFTNDGKASWTTSMSEKHWQIMKPVSVEVLICCYSFSVVYKWSLYSTSALSKQYGKNEST